MKNLLLKTGLRNVIGLSIEASESTKYCGQFRVFDTFFNIFVRVFLLLKPIFLEQGS